MVVTAKPAAKRRSLTRAEMQCFADNLIRWIALST
jgi:hypothetical protein